MSAEILRALFLGALQGATEFLPVSSSGHLVIVPALLGWPAASLTFDVAVHWATALAVLVYFRQDWARLLTGAWHGLRTRDRRAGTEVRFLVLLFAATLPAVAAGLIVQEPLERAIAHNPDDLARLAAALLLVSGAILFVSDRLGAGERRADDVRARGAIGVGLAQAAAILPGISRSGATIAAGLGAGLTRPEAARFSFLLATPVILGAGLLQLSDALREGVLPGEPAALAAGFVSAAVVGYVAIGWLLRYLRHARLTLFVIYLWVAGALALWLLR